jgi:hypothetical protein
MVTDSVVVVVARVLVVVVVGARVGAAATVVSSPGVHATATRQRTTRSEGIRRDMCERGFDSPRDDLTVVPCRFNTRT